MSFGAMTSSSTQQKANPRSLTEVELINVEDKTSKVMWSKRFAELKDSKCI